MRPCLPYDALPQSHTAANSVIDQGHNLCSGSGFCGLVAFNAGQDLVSHLDEYNSFDGPMSGVDLVPSNVSSLVDDTLLHPFNAFAAPNELVTRYYSPVWDDSSSLAESQGAPLHNYSSGGDTDFQSNTFSFDPALNGNPFITSNGMDHFFPGGGGPTAVPNHNQYPMTNPMGLGTYTFRRQSEDTGLGTPHTLQHPSGDTIEFPKTDSQTSSTGVGSGNSSYHPQSPAGTSQKGRKGTLVIEARAKCAHCGKTFSRVYDLDRHATKHQLGIDKYQCGVEGCEYGGSHRLDKMGSHMKNRHLKGNEYLGVLTSGMYCFPKSGDCSFSPDFLNSEEYAKQCRYWLGFSPYIEYSSSLAPFLSDDGMKLKRVTGKSEFYDFDSAWKYKQQRQQQQLEKRLAVS